MQLTVPGGNGDVLERARRYVAKCPPAISGQGGHAATFRVACVLVHGFALSDNDALAILKEWNQSCQPPWPESDLIYKINSGRNTTSKYGTGYLLSGEKREATVTTTSPTPPSAPRPKGEPKPIKNLFKPEILKRVAAAAGPVDVNFIKERSPYCPETQTAATFLQHLYRPGEKVLVFDVYKSQGKFLFQRAQQGCDVRQLNHYRNGCPDGVWYLCMPVDGEFHANPRLGGKRSRRSGESITDWRYLVLESDEAEAGLWLAMVVQLPLRIAAIYTSGGESIHVLVRVDASSKADWDAKAERFKKVMCVLGADPRNITAVRLTRLPFCFRGQKGPPRPVRRFDYPRWVDEPLTFDEHGDPILVPPPRPAIEPPDDLWTGGKLQELLYLNPNPDTQPIQHRPTRQQIHAEWLAKVRQMMTEGQP
jgi:hypothetical protein